MDVCKCVYRSEADLGFHSPDIILFNETGSLTGLMLAHSARLVVQRAPGISFFSPSLYLPNARIIRMCHHTGF